MLDEYVSVVKGMFSECKTYGVTSVGETEEVEIEVELHQGSALSPFHLLESFSFIGFVNWMSSQKTFQSRSRERCCLRMIFSSMTAPGKASRED